MFNSQFPMLKARNYCELIPLKAGADNLIVMRRSGWDCRSVGMADKHASEACARKGVEVQLLSPAQSSHQSFVFSLQTIINMYKFEKLIVWKLSLEFIKDIYSFSNTLPKNEQRNIIDQLKRATVSINLNITEGSGSENDLEFKRYLHIARKSLFETIAILKITEYLYQKKINGLLEKANTIGKLLNGLVKYLKQSDV